MLETGPRSSRRNWFKKLNILTVPSLHIFSLTMFVVNNLDNFHANSSIHCTNTKHKSQLQIPLVKYSSIQHTRVGTCHKGLNPCDYDLIPKMKEPLRGIRFRTVPEILQAVDRSIRTINTTGAAKGIPRLPHRWQRVVNNAGDYIEGE